MMEETKICNKCNRELPIERFELMKPKNKNPYRLNTCKVCRYSYYNEMKKKQREVVLSDDIEVLVHRSYKYINPARILDLSKTEIQPIGEDEIFVKLMDYKDLWLSNYGRAVDGSDNQYSLMQGYYDKDGKLCYVGRKCVYSNGKWTYKKTTIYAAHEVVREFIVNPDTVNNVFVWHRGYNKRDNYYKNLYPLNKDQYYAVKRYYNQHGDDSEEVIVKIMNDIKYKPENWSAKSMKPTMCGIGYAGKSDVDRNSVAYIRWHDMINRCYNTKFHAKQPQYAQCTVCEEWLNFSNFEKWYNENLYQIEDMAMDLDKDILIKGNKEYSPATCCIVPHCINTLFLTGKKSRGDLPIGIWQDKREGRYRAAMSYQGIQIKIGSFKNAEDAFNRYKVYKEDFIQDIAEQHKGDIPDKTYQAMMNWKVEITD